MTVQLFQFHIPEPVLVDLRERIRKTRWPDEQTGSAWTFGTSLSYMKELADYWLKEFDWRKPESTINQYPNFVAEIEGYKIHFLHVHGNCYILSWPT